MRLSHEIGVHAIRMFSASLLHQQLQKIVLLTNQYVNTMTHSSLSMKLCSTVDCIAKQQNCFRRAIVLDMYAKALPGCRGNALSTCSTFGETLIITGLTTSAALLDRLSILSVHSLLFRANWMTGKRICRHQHSMLTHHDILLSDLHETRPCFGTRLFSTVDLEGSASQALLACKTHQFETF